VAPFDVSVFVVLPGSQGAHDVEPAPPTNVPAGHGSHAFVEEEKYSPGLQSEHDVAPGLVPVFVELPAGHTLQAIVGASEYQPTGQARRGGGGGAGK